ncbi:MAG TPA: GNAT family N-acetyltransferase [Steroidobacteraceae bacterium]|jgi:ribosomal protein S18 acetylase RimI-like enzyme
MSTIQIVPFQPKYAADFRRLNLDWIERLFKVEAPDLKVLNDPQGVIIAPGGMVFFALDGEQVVGTVAMIRTADGRCELAKMAVATTHQGRGIGELLGRACTAWAAEQDLRTVFLETNSKLENAIRLYERLGFRRAIEPNPPDYVRCDVYMETPIRKRGG